MILVGKRLPIRLILAGAVLAAATPATAHPRDLMSPGRAGPIIRNQTTQPQLRSWFGPPDDTRSVTLGCSQLLEAKWNRGVTAFLSRTTPRYVVATFIRRRSIRSDQHGDLVMHTARGLRVGAPEARLRRLYPNAEPITHAGHTHYRLRTAPDGGYLMAKAVDRTVVRFENWPYEFC